MGLRINNNIAAMNAYRNLSATDGQMSKASKNLSASESRIRDTGMASEMVKFTAHNSSPKPASQCSPKPTNPHRASSHSSKARIVS